MPFGDLMTDKDDLQRRHSAAADTDLGTLRAWEWSALLGSVLHAVADSADEEAAATAILEGLGVVLGLSGSALSTLTPAAGQRRLETISATGTHAGFAREMPSLALDGASEAASVLSQRTPAFVGDVHGLGRGSAERSESLGRWRRGVATNAYAHLPLLVRDEPLGVLTLEWAELREFAAEDEIVLGQVAGLVGLALHSFRSGGGRPMPASVTPRLCEEASAVTLSVTPEGVVVPAPERDQWGVAEKMRLTVLANEPRSRDTASAFWEAAGIAPERLMLVVGTAVSPSGGAEALAEASRQILRARISRGGTPAESLRTLGDSLGTAASHGAWVSARVAVIDLARSTLTESHCGSAALLLLEGGTRFELALPATPPVGTSGAEVEEDRFRFLLPRDGLALCTGRVTDLADGQGITARQALAELPDTGGVPAAQKLLEVVSGESCAEAVIVA
jgi:hypothetical protein